MGLDGLADFKANVSARVLGKNSRSSYDTRP